MKIDIPVRSGFIISPSSVQNSKSYINPQEGLQIYSKDKLVDSVFSLTGGVVVNVNSYENFFLCAIRFENYLFTYANLSSCLLKKDYKVGKGEFIGRVGQDENSGKSIRLVISYKNELLNINQHLKFLNSKIN
ncbi:MAG: hypothetical protein KF816_17550 [Melioribacteraceae bacterium]|nr:hypothetical protein [Chitinophagaceae bacterium]MBX3009835.1 hypothetical protein [Melioribacteraceae bacterium]